MSYGYNKLDYKRRYETYFVTTPTLAIFYMIIDQLFYNSDEIECAFPLVFLPILYSPIIIIYQLILNLAIIKEVKHDNENKD